MKKIKINTSENDAVVIIGISSTMKDYRLSWFLNKELSLKLFKQKDLDICSDASKKKFSFYVYEESENLISYYFISNRNQESEILLQEQKKIDFFLIIIGTKATTGNLLSKIKNIPNVQTAFLINTNTIKSFSNLMEDIEMHLMEINKIKKTKL